MTDYRIEVSATAERQLKGLAPRDRERVVSAILALGKEPRPRGCRKLHGYDDVYRIRNGPFRIIYSIEDKRLLIIILKLGHRRSVYR